MRARATKHLSRFLYKFNNMLYCVSRVRARRSVVLPVKRKQETRKCNYTGSVFLNCARFLALPYIRFVSIVTISLYTVVRLRFESIWNCKQLPKCTQSPIHTTLGHFVWKKDERLKSLYVSGMTSISHFKTACCKAKSFNLAAHQYNKSYHKKTNLKNMFQRGTAVKICCKRYNTYMSL